MPKPSSEEALVVPHSWFAVSVYFSGYVVLEAFWKYSPLLYNGKAAISSLSTARLTCSAFPYVPYVLLVVYLLLWCFVFLNLLLLRQTHHKLSRSNHINLFHSGEKTATAHSSYLNQDACVLEQCCRL